MQFKDWILNEEIFPNKTATVFHRTKDINYVERIFRSGFKPGGGAMYGPGLYTTFDLRSQFKPQMSLYGEFVIKFKATNLDKYLITSFNVAKYVFGRNYKISDQFKSFGWSQTIRPKSMDVETYGTGFEEYDLLQKSSTYSSDLAFKIYEENRWIAHSLTGLIYNGRQDGYCLVKYEPINDGLVMVGYAQAPVNDQNKLQELEANEGWITSNRSGKIKHMYSKADLWNSGRNTIDSTKAFRLSRNSFQEKLEDILEDSKGSVKQDKEGVHLKRLQWLLIKEEVDEEKLIYIIRRYPNKDIVKTTVLTLAKNKPNLITKKLVENLDHSAYDTYGLYSIIIDLNSLLKEDVIESMISAANNFGKNKKPFLKSLAEKQPRLSHKNVLFLIKCYGVFGGGNYDSAVDIINFMGELGYFSSLTFKIIDYVFDDIVSDLTSSFSFKKTTGRPDDFGIIQIVKAFASHKSMSLTELSTLIRSAYNLLYSQDERSEQSLRKFTIKVAKNLEGNETYSSFISKVLSPRGLEAVS